MSRTYRMHENTYYHANGKFYTVAEWKVIWDEQWKEISKRYRKGEDCFSFPPCSGWTTFTRIEKQKDKKPWYKPDHGFKSMKRRCERAKVRHAMKNDHEIPLFKKGDVWDWT